MSVIVSMCKVLAIKKHRARIVHKQMVSEILHDVLDNPFSYLPVKVNINTEESNLEETPI